MAPWTPRGVDPSAHAALTPGIPPWSASQVERWIVPLLKNKRGYLNSYVVELWDVAMHNNPADADHWGSGLESVERYWRWLGAERQLDFLDWFIHRIATRIDGETVLGRLEAILYEGGSAERVGMRGNFAGLEDRVPLGVAEAADAIMTGSSTAGALLSEAWHAAYGRNPDPEEAYEKAIKAVEEAGAEVVLPNTRATLGQMIAAMRDQTDWYLPVEGPNSAQAPLAMAQALWQGQPSRHGGNGYRTPTPAEAEAAVLLAVPLVQFFAAGLVARRNV